MRGHFFPPSWGRRPAFHFFFYSLLCLFFARGLCGIRMNLYALSQTMSITQATAYTWSTLVSDSPMPLLTRQRVIGEKMMLSRVFLHKGCDVPTHSHENEQISCIMSGKVRFGIGAVGSSDRREVTLGEDQVLHLPPNVPHSALALEDSLVLDLFSPPSQTTGIDRPVSDASRRPLGP